MKPIRWLKQVHTGHVWANIHNCKACGKCVKACPKQVIGETGFLWHKHIIFKKPEDCTGCKKCVKICPYGVFNEKIVDVFKNAVCSCCG